MNELDGTENDYFGRGFREDMISRNLALDKDRDSACVDRRHSIHIQPSSIIRDYFTSKVLLGFVFPKAIKSRKHQSTLLEDRLRLRL